SARWNALHDAIAAARDAPNTGIIFVAACGNNGHDNDSHPLYPASYTDLDNIIAVAATGENDDLAVFPPQNPPVFQPPLYEASNYGLTKVHLGAPGLDSWSTCLFCGSPPYQGGWWGTSMAAPHVAGACALVWAKYPSENYRQIITRVLTAVDPVPSLAG